MALLSPSLVTPLVQIRPITLRSACLSTALFAHNEYSLSLERESIDIATLPYHVKGRAAIRQLRTAAPGYAAADGSRLCYLAKTPTLLLTACWLTACCKIRQALKPLFYIDAVCGDDGVDDSLSEYIEAPITLNGFEISQH